MLLSALDVHVWFDPERELVVFAVPEVTYRQIREGVGL